MPFTQETTIREVVSDCGSPFATNDLETPSDLISSRHYYASSAIASRFVECSSSVGFRLASGAPKDTLKSDNVNPRQIAGGVSVSADVVSCGYRRTQLGCEGYVVGPATLRISLSERRSHNSGMLLRGRFSNVPNRTRFLTSG